MRPLQRWREQRLLRRVSNGDRDAAGQLVDAHYEAAYHWLLHLCGDSEQAADLTQDTFLQVWEGLEGFEGRSSLKTWVHRIAYHAFLRAQRSPEPEKAPLSEAANGPAADQPMLARGAVQQALAQLPQAQQSVVLLHYIQGLTCAEIAHVLDIPLGTVLSRLHAARGTLREVLSDDPSPSRQEVEADVAQE